MAVADYFLALDGIQGESHDAKHEGEIELVSFSWGEAAAAGPARGAGAGAGKVKVEDLHVLKKVDRASPQLLLACASGKHLKQAVLTVRRSGAKQLDFLVYRFGDVVVASYRTGGSAEAEPTDQVSFSFARIQVELRPQKRDGSLDAAVTAGWDVKAGRKL